ncbi:hypothetical protein [Shewanella morhuae]|uniref:hypothetical protein n=1 Tax=Shewanella morhuae TaxID=365591 RepID=UPI001BBF470D|nr:hypothetical protein [Shewanella morhuae]GIU04867.1 hypothetical protein TUM4641_13740 [Shewanella morhuae]
MSVFEYKDKGIIHECMTLGDVYGQAVWQYLIRSMLASVVLDNGPKLTEELCVAFQF